MSLTIQPRLQTERFSLYWKEPLTTETRCLSSFVMDVPDKTATLQSILEAAAERLGWAPVKDLQRLDGFKDDWERAIYRGLPASLSLH